MVRVDKPLAWERLQIEIQVHRDDENRKAIVGCRAFPGNLDWVAIATGLPYQ